MYFYRIQSFLDTFGQPDWKGIEISKNIPGSQVYYGNEVIFANIEKVQAEGVLSISEGEYLALRENWLAVLRADSIEQRLADLEAAYADLVGGVA